MRYVGEVKPPAYFLHQKTFQDFSPVDFIGLIQNEWFLSLSLTPFDVYPDDVEKQNFSANVRASLQDEIKRSIFLMMSNLMCVT